MKAIFIIRIPIHTQSTNLEEAMDMVARKLHTDYHVLPILDGSVDRVEFECCNVQNVESKDIEEIKQMVLKQFKNEQ